jgi:hypothetical protein
MTPPCGYMWSPAWRPAAGGWRAVRRSCSRYGGPGALLGELSAIDREPRSATVTATEKRDRSRALGVLRSVSEIRRVGCPSWSETWPRCAVARSHFPPKPPLRNVTRPYSADSIHRCTRLRPFSWRSVRDSGWRKSGRSQYPNMALDPYLTDAPIRPKAKSRPFGGGQASQGASDRHGGQRHHEGSVDLCALRT